MHRFYDPNFDKALAALLGIAALLALYLVQIFL